jgi:Na+-driven multidrug efflux pump
MILSTSGLVNVLLNVVFVLLFKMTVDGVALATIISQYISAVWVLAVLLSRKGEGYSINLKQIGIHKETLFRILRYGIPSALQGSMFSIANVLITSATNVFTSIEISAKTIVSNVDGIIYSSLNSYMHTAMTVTAQNYGAGEHRRIKRAYLYCLIQVAVIGVVLGGAIALLSDPITSLFISASDPNREIILKHSRDLLLLLATTYVLCGIQETLAGALRGLGYALSTMFISIIVICGGRILWITAFYNIPALQTLNGLYAVYPVTWIAISLVFGIFSAIVLSRVSKKLKKSETAEDIPIKAK